MQLGEVVAMSVATTSDPSTGTIDQIAMALVKVLRIGGCTAQAKIGGLDKGALFVLATLVEHGQQRSSVLAERVYADPSTVSRQVSALVKLGYIERWPDQDDGRASVLAATEDGAAYIERRRRIRNALVTDLLEDWDEADLRELSRLLPAFVTAFESRLPEMTARLAVADDAARVSGEGIAE